MQPNRRLLLKAILILLGLAALSACVPLLDSPFSPAHWAAAGESAGSLDIAGALDRIRSWHAANGTEIPAILNPGAERETVLAIFEGLPCQPTEELLDLWAWQDGAGETFVPFIWYHDFLSAEGALEEYSRLVDSPIVGWREEWIPVFKFEGEWYFAVCAEEIEPAGPVGYFFLEETEAVYAYVSLSAMLETSAAYLERGAVVWDETEGGMVEDIRQVFEIHQELNPGTLFPYASD